jgi:AcrR family transcriptional regulator
MEPQRRAGRPRSFDTGRALDAALEVFWRHGYEGTSIAALTGATGLNPPNLYGAFGDKATLYRRCLDRYVELEGLTLRPEGPAGDAVRDLLLRAAETFADERHPPGCMISTACLTTKSGHDDVRADVARRRAATIATVRDRLAVGIADGELRADADPDALARLVGAVIQGLSVQAIDGADAPTLRTVAEAAAAAIPFAGGRREPSAPS